MAVEKSSLAGHPSLPNPFTNRSYCHNGNAENLCQSLVAQLWNHNFEHESGRKPSPTIFRGIQIPAAKYLKVSSSGIKADSPSGLSALDF